MKIFFLLSIITIAILYIGKQVIYSAKRNLFKDHAAWSSKEIKINFGNSNKISGSESNGNYLKVIADESRIYLEDQSKIEE
tara:strand:+ start:133 stop:375 length:243 start_codon:yes stop_codon:yes gene_type:complete